MKKSLLALASGTLGLGIAEFVMMGVLPNVAHDLGISIPQAGHFISAYAVGVCVGAPLMVLVARTRPLKQILLGLAAIYVLGNLFASLSPNYWTLLVMRFVCGLPHGAFFGVGSIVAEKIADKGKASQAVSLMTAGMTIANLFGVPFGTMFSNMFSWRLPFMFNAVWGILVYILLWKWIPSLPALPDSGLKGQFRFLTHLAPWLIILTTMFGNGGVFCWFSYVTPQMIHEAGFSPENMTLIMMFAGLGMTIGNLVGGKFGDLYGLAPVIRMTQVVMILALLGTYFFAGNPVLSVLLMFVGTAALFAVSPPQQLLLLQNSRGSEMMGAACVQIAFNLGNALGAYAGGLPIDAGMGYRYPALVGVFVVMLGLVCVSVYVRREKMMGRQA
ncbi:MFS transporter AraJ [uncultured Bacteroides sp.]|jgi:DHA1 family arabinose polymer transporter-like MFS transporter|uniref:MFS transporter AraJ n=1 Tax=uncultured Bacteroides sp. TaxID=162156 RepID=UPI00280AD115|nr:MFS transporter AraJ [uncultured Bacteroides sp.]